MTKQRCEAAAAARVAAGLGRRKRSELLGLLRPAFARTGPWLQAGRYVGAVMSDMPKRNGWTIAAHAGDRSPDRTQRLLNRASWDTLAAMGIVRRFAVAGLDEAAGRAGRRCLAVGALDETGQEKKGRSTAGVQRQHMGCAGGVENGINTVHLSYVREGVGHALIGARQWIPAGQIDDPVTSVVTALPLGLRFRTKGQLAIDVLAAAFADGIALDYVTGDEVYGSCTELREYLEGRGQGYVLRVPSNFRVTLARGVTAPAGDATGLLSGHLTWEVRSAGTGSKGQRWYARAQIELTSPRHCLLLRRHLATGELAYHCCYVPEGQRAGTTRLIRAAGLRWPVEEDFEFGKDCFGLDQSQVRLYHAIARHTVLVMAALAICAVTAALLKARTGTQAPPPLRPGQAPPADPGMIPLTVPEVRRLLASATPPALPPGHTIHWSGWTRTHHARATWFHQRTRLERDQQIIMKPLAS